jgi:hypothetical protein
MGLTLTEARKRIDAILRGYQRARGDLEQSVLPTTIAAGKTYEAWVLCEVLEHLRADEGYEITLHASSNVVLKTGGGPINRGFCHFGLTGEGLVPLEVWTDIEVLGLSARARGVTQASAQACDYHELDIVAVDSGATMRPWPEELALGVECKDSGYTKDMLRSLLGIRREMSLLQYPEGATRFRSWPRPTVPAEPPSCLLAYSVDAAILAFAPPGELFGIDFFHEEMI